MNLWGRKWSPCRISLPSSANPPKASLSNAVTLGIKFSTFRSCWMSILPSWQIDGEKVEMTHFIFLGSKITVDGDCSWKIKKCLLLGRKAMTNLDSVFKSRDITLPTKVHIVKAIFFFSIYVQIWKLDPKEGWAPKDGFFWIAVLEKTLESPLNCKEAKPVEDRKSVV